MTRLAVHLLVLALFVAGCASGLHRGVASVEAVTGADGVQRVEVDFHSFYFNPNRIVVHRGRPVELLVRNRSLIVPHNFTIADSAMSVSVNKWGPGSARVRFTPEAEGEYEFRCHVDQHAKKGMTGTLVVVP